MLYTGTTQCTESSPWSSFPQYPGVYTPAEPTKSTAQVLSLIDTLMHSDSIQIDPDRVYVTAIHLVVKGHLISLPVHQIFLLLQFLFVELLIQPRRN
jgi:hypothetical protein